MIARRPLAGAAALLWLLARSPARAQGPNRLPRVARISIGPLADNIGLDLVALGLASSLARPGGNVTGLQFHSGPAMQAKRPQLLKRAVPAVKRITFLHRSPVAGEPAWPAATTEAARQLGPVLSAVAVDAPEDFDAAFAAISRHRPDAIWCPDSPVNLSNRARITAFAARERLPSFFGLRQFADAGGLVSYSTNLAEVEHLAARYIDKTLKGAKPGELTIEQPTRFEFVINLKTAPALGITIPPVAAVDR